MSLNLESSRNLSRIRPAALLSAARSRLQRFPNSVSDKCSSSCTRTATIDIKGDSFNVDHVVISPKGIYVIETKTHSKPASGNAAINYDGQRVLINGKESLSDILVQVTAATSYIKKIINDSTGKQFEPFPFVLFPGCFVNGGGNHKGKLWVLEPKAFRKFLDRQTVKLSDEDVKLASYHLSRHIRTS